jgi:hypothetical protein
VKTVMNLWVSENVVDFLAYWLPCGNSRSVLLYGILSLDMMCDVGCVLYSTMQCFSQAHPGTPYQLCCVRQMQCLALLQVCISICSVSRLPIKKDIRTLR